MRQARALVPYAATALVVVVTSVLALGYAVSDLRDLRQAATDRAQATATPQARSLPELSRIARLAYWRTDPSGGGELTVSDLDGGRRRAIARSDSTRRVTLTRWMPDGEAVVFVDNGATLSVVRLDGTRTDLTLPDDARAAGGRIVDHRWSPGGARVAASVVRADLRSDVYLASAGDRTFTRATTLDDMFTADWLADDEVLVSSGGGVVGVLRAGTANAIRPLTGLPATSPILTDDGRIHFLSGAVTATPRDITLPYLTASGATVWSIAADGTDLRRETRNQMDDLRLDGRYGSGRYLAHRGSSQLQVLLSEGVNIPPIDAGPVERVVVAPDGRSAIGFSANRIIRFDLVRGQALGTFSTPSVMLDSVAGGDVWHARGAATIPRGTPVSGAPPARAVFSLGGHLWTLAPDGTAAFFRARAPQSGRRAPPPPPWSPRGDRILTVEPAGVGLPGITAATPIAVSIDRDGRATRYAESRAATGTPSWSPAGDAFAVVVDRRGVDGTSTQADLEVRFLAVDGSIARPAVPGRDALWTTAGIYVLTSTSIDLVDGQARRQVVSLPELLADPRGDFPAERTSTTVASLGGTRDGAYLSVRISVTPRTGANRFAIALIRTADGRAEAFLPGSTVQDLAWSPSGAVGYTLTTSSTTEPATRIHAAAGGPVARAQPGRFAGWSPDGSFYYLALAEGLFAYPLGDGAAVRVSAIGVPVSATRP